MSMIIVGGKNFYGEEAELIEQGYTPAQIQEMNEMLRWQQHQDRDTWGPVCPGCSQWGHATKGCGLYCLKNKPRPAGERR